VADDQYIFVDLRDQSEQIKTGIISGAVCSSCGMLEFHRDPESPSHKTELGEQKTFSFSCASGGNLH
jgi:hypothetical protein